MFKKAIATGAVGFGIFIGGQAVSASPVEYSGDSIVDYLYQSGQDHSFENRGKLAKEKGISNYSGTASQNLYLLASLRGESPKHKPEAAAAKAVKKEQAAPATKKESKAANTKVEGRTLTVSATAYTAYCTGCSGITYTGQNLKANPNQKVIAVDPNVIPLGSKVYVEGYGEAIAGDIGGAIKGNKIDVFIPSKEAALNWGRKTVKVTILN